MSHKLYFIPGTMCDQRLWQSLWPELLGAYEPVHLAIPEAESIEQIVDQLSQQLPDEPVNLVGFSLGGYLASAIYCRAPQRIARLMVLSNSPQGLPQSEIDERAKAIGWVNKNGYNGIPLKKVQRLLHVDNRSDRAITDLICQMDAEMGQAVLVQQLQATTKRVDLAPLLKQARRPIQFCFGDQDGLVDGTLLNKLAEQNSNLCVTEVAGSGHMLPLERPTELAQVINNWFQGER